MRSPSFPWYPTLLVTFVNVFAANRRSSSPKEKILIFLFFTRIREGGRGKTNKQKQKTKQKKTTQSKKRNLTKE